MNRYILGALVALLMLAGLPFAVYGEGPGREVIAPSTASAPVPVSSVSPVASTSSVSRTPQEDDPDFNPCVHGVNGTYAHWDGSRLVVDDPRYYIPGPCDITTRLPHGRYFSVRVQPISDGGVDCAGYVHIEVTVFVHERNGDIRGGVGMPGCAPRGALVGSDGVSGPAEMDVLYRNAATQYGS